MIISGRAPNKTVWKKKREPESTLHEYSQCPKGHRRPCFFHMQNVTRSFCSHFILKLCVSYISTGELRRRCCDVNCFGCAQKGLSSLQASNCSPVHTYVILAIALLILVFFFSRHGALVPGFSFFSSFSRCSVSWVGDLFSHYLQYVSLPLSAAFLIWSASVFCFVFLFLLQIKILTLFETHLHGQTLFSSLTGDRVWAHLPGSGHTSNRHLCPRQKSKHCKITSYSTTDFT